jgi:hypothetical protein
LKLDDFKDDELKAFEGPMITVLGTSLQNKDILSYFMNTSWKAIGLEMEGAHYQKAIQVASKIRHHISPDLFVCMLIMHRIILWKQEVPFFRRFRIYRGKTNLSDYLRIFEKILQSGKKEVSAKK